MIQTCSAFLALFMVATFAVADGHGGPGPGAPGGHGPEAAGYLDVAGDGTVIITRAAANSTAAAPVAEVVAIRNGAIAWTSTLPSLHTDIEPSGSQLPEAYD